MPTRITMYTPADPDGTTTTITTTTTAAAKYPSPATLPPSSSSPPLAFSDEELAVLTPFQKRVYHLLKQIPAGRVTTYGSMARALRTSPRAVGNALRNNVFAPRIPCHRCVASTGYVNGYDGEVIQKASFSAARGGTATGAGAGARAGAPVVGKASQSRAGKVKAGMAQKQQQQQQVIPPSGTNIRKKLDLLESEGVLFDAKGMLQNKYKVLFDGPWDILPE